MREQEEKLRQLRIRESKAEQEQDYNLAFEIKEQRLILELELLQGLKETTTSSSLFTPKKHNEIKALNMEVIGKDFIPLIKGGYNVLAGRGGVGKSAIALKSMLLWLRDNPNKNALAMFTEDAISEIKKRARIICSNCSLDQDIIDRIFFISLDNDDRIKWVTNSRDGYNVRTDYIQQLISFCKENRIEYVILDPLKRFHSLSENSNDDMDVLVRDCFVSIAAQTNSVLLVLHHSAKSGDGGGRGASTITDTARVSWKVGKYYMQDNLTKEIKMVEEKKNKIKLEIIKDNNGIEKDCTIRAEHDKSIDNPLAFRGYEKPIETVFNNEENDYMSSIA